jgi:formylmethanofuran dehydrogenase subunit E-like metal-binding protein
MKKILVRVNSASNKLHARANYAYDYKVASEYLGNYKIQYVMLMKSMITERTVKKI